MQIINAVNNNNKNDILSIMYCKELEFNNLVKTVIADNNGLI